MVPSEKIETIYVKRKKKIHNTAFMNFRAWVRHSDHI